MCFSLEVSRDILGLGHFFKAEIDRQAFRDLKKNHDLNPKAYPLPDDDNRIFPNYYAPILLHHEGKPLITPMRYRLHPSWSEEEIPSKYNLFNARVDMLEKRKSWKQLFLKRHGIVPFKSFFEWVVGPKGKKQLMNFYPQDRELMWAPCLWDHWVKKDKSQEIFSFALITTEPPKEVLEAGHDRCPLFLDFHEIPTWLKSENLSRERAYTLLKHLTKTHYNNRFY